MVKDRWTGGNTVVYNCGYHLIWCPKYRRKVLVGDVGKRMIVKIDRWLPTSKPCARCGLLQEMPLSCRHFNCPGCGWSCPREQNAAINIVAAGALAAGLGDVRREYVRAVSA